MIRPLAHRVARSWLGGRSMQHAVARRHCLSRRAPACDARAMPGAAYLFIETRITDPEQYQKYVEAARAFWHSTAYRDVRRLREGAGEVHVVVAEDLPAAPAESVRTPLKG
jgi:hypothetical protein